ncbi:MAG: TssA family type VI secretion system protein [Saccharospirillum sp.]|nr:TssA family type VI secretion system protein [Saccharospirillum sp.]
MTISTDNALSMDWAELHQAIHCALTPEATGEDPRYNEHFSQLKTEVEKRADVDFESIFNISCYILSQISKDLRVAGYLVLSAGRLQGLSGFGQALSAYNKLLTTYGQALHPVRDKARQGAIRWVLQDKILSFTQAATKEPDLESIERSLQAFEEFCQITTDYLDEPPGWPDLTQWLKKLKDENTPKTTTAPESAKPAAAETSQSNEPSSTPAIPSNIGSEKDLLQHYKQLLQHYREKQLFATAAGIARAIKWADLKLPVNEQGKTRLPAPRQPSLNRIKSALEAEQWQEAWLAAEDAFFEPSGQFCFDIQYLAHQAATRGAMKTAACIVESHILTLFERLPKLAQLKFENDEPFVSGAAAAWIEQLQSRAGDQGSTTQQGPDLLGQARETADSESVIKALQWLNLQHDGSQLTSMRVRLAQARLCMEHQKTTEALPMLQRLGEQAEQSQLAELEPQLAVQIWRQLQFALQDRQAADLPDDQKAANDQQLERLHSLICTTDIAQAAQWF